MSEGRYKAAAVLTIAALSFGVGQCSAKQDADSKSDSPTPKVVPGSTETVIKTETVTRESMPISCKEALRLAARINSDADPLINVANQALDMMEQAHEAMAEEDGTRLNALRTDLYKLGAKTSKPTMDLKVDVVPQFQKRMSACMKSDPYKAR